MHPAEAPLTLARAAVVRPSGTHAWSDWLDALTRCYAAAPTPERTLCEMVYGDAGLDARALGTAAPAVATTRFRCAGSESQRDLAGAALDALFAGAGAPSAECRLLLYAAASMDARFHQSPVGWLAASHGLTRHPHFALAQLQGASLACAADLVDAMLPADGAAAFVAAEAWPLPFPRSCVAPALLGDAAAALWLTRAAVPGLRLAGTWQQGFDPFLAGSADDRGAAMASGPLFDAAAGAIAAALERHAVAAADIDLWLPSGLDAQLDERLRLRCAPRAALAAAPRADDGYLCSAAAPVLCAEVLDRLAAGAVAEGELLLSWGASLGGAIGVSLWRATATGARLS